MFQKTMWLAVMLALQPWAEADATGPVHTQSGWVAGVPARDPAITVYKGIPYAAPPIGALRWSPPRPPVRWSGVRAADHFGASCPQARPDPSAPMSEDCLYLNVWSSASSTRALRPVFVWIYGGAFLGGSGSSPQFDGEGLARKGLVVVTFNYRIGALGFLATPELSLASGHHASGNFGVLDDIAALQWVHRSIAAFGGDPARVTIAGQSAGAGAVGFLSMSPLAKGLFRRSIAQSHARYPRDPELRYLSTSWRSLTAAEGAGVKFALSRGAHSLAELRAMPWQQLIVDGTVYDPDVETGSSAKPPLFRPVVDGWVIPFNYSDTFARGAQNAVSFMAGNNLDESGAVPETAFAALQAPGAGAAVSPGMPPINVTLADLRDSACHKFGAMAEEFLDLYPAASDQQAAQANNAAVRDNSRISTFLWATEWKRGVKPPVYTYFWTHAPPGSAHERRGAYHGSEIPYIFNNLYAVDLPWTDQDRRIADLMSSYWASFAATGDPNGEGRPYWPPVDLQSPTVMELGDHFGPIPVAAARRLDFWKRFFARQQAW